VRVEYTITEYDSDDEQVHQEQGTDYPRYGDVEDYARGLVTEWVPVDVSTETWRARVCDEDGNIAEAIGPRNDSWRVEPPPLPDRKALVAQLEPLTRTLRRLTEPLAGRDDLPALYRLLPLAAELLAGVQFALNTAGDPYGTGRANLQGVQSGARLLGTTAAQALAEERSNQ
jgi:hypothetical protein